MTRSKSSSFPRSASASRSVSSVHDQATGDVDGLPGHVSSPVRGEKADHFGDVLWMLHTSEWHLGGALLREILRREAQQGTLLAGDELPHVGLYEARADAV